MRRALALSMLVLGACDEPRLCPPADLAPIEGEPAYAFVASDYASSAVGLLDAEGHLLREAWLDSGTTPPGLVATISGDVVLGSTPLAPCVVTVIDRSGTDAITLLDACAAQDVVLGQIDVGPSFYANPQDAIPLDERRALISRSEPNTHPDAAPMERGNDLLVVDWREKTVLSRIDLSGLDVSLGDERVHARPERLAILEKNGARVVVAGLARLTRSYLAGPGAVAILDLDTLDPVALELEGLSNCGEVAVAPGAREIGFVTCKGPTFGTEAERREEAGVVALELEESGEVRVRGIWRAAEHPERPAYNSWSVPLSADRVTTIAMGDVGQGRPDRIGVIAPGEGASLFLEADDAFVFGQGAFDPQRDLLLLPDAHGRTIRRFSMSSASELEPVQSSPCRSIPPRELRRISP